jgi:polyvinyl alcohol dehydrogenase (cytochrome)
MRIRRVETKSFAGWGLSSSLLICAVAGCAGSPQPAQTNQGAQNWTTPGSTTPGTGSPTASAAGATATTPTMGATPSMPGQGTPGANTDDVANPGAAPVAGTGAPATAGGGAPTAAAGSGSTPTDTPPSDATVDWTVMGYDPGSTYFNRGETMLSKDTAAQLDVLWTADLGGNVLGGALQVGDKMYASGPGGVYAFDAASGTEVWRVTAGSSSTLGYADNTLYLHSTGGNVIAFDAADGKMKWTMRTDASGGDGSASPLPVGGLVLVGASNGGAELGGGRFRGYMTAMDAATGANKWTTFTVPEGSVGASFWSSPSASMEDNLVFGGTGNNYGPPATDSSDSIIAFDWTTGEIKWKYQAVMNDTFPGNFSAPDADFGNNPVVYEATVGGAPTKLVADGTKYGNVVALQRLTGAMVWKRDVCKSGSADGNQGMFTNFSYSGKSIVAACNEGGPATLYALDAATGDMLWMRALTGRVWGRMAFANGVGVVGTGEAVEIFDVDTGAVIKTFQSKGGTVASTITISRGRIAFGEGFTWSTGNRSGSTLTVLGIK